MPSHQCQHQLWVEAIEGGVDRKLIYHNRLQALAEALPSPTTQTPCVSLFLGNASKDQALKQLFIHNKFGRRRRLYGGLLTIRCETSSIKSDNTHYFADVDPLISCGLEYSRANCHPQAVLPVTWPNTDDTPLRDFVLSRPVFPFTDVVCMFADDFGGYGETIGILSKWAAMSRSSQEPNNPGPHVVIVTSAAITTGQEPSCFKGAYIGTTIVQSKSACPRLNAKIMRLLDRSVTSKRAHSVVFTAQHQAALSEAAMENFARTVHEPFNLVQASRADREVNPDLHEYAVKALNLAAREGARTDTVLSLTATSLLVDACPAGMHGRLPNSLRFLCID